MDKKATESYCREYMDFLAKAKTERRAYAEAVRLLEKAGFRSAAFEAVVAAYEKTVEMGKR